MTQVDRGVSLGATGNVPGNRFSWVWLLIGFLLLPFTAWQTVIPLAVWLAPVFLLRFARTPEHERVRLLMVFAAYAVGHFIAIRGFKWNNLFELAVWLILIPLSRGLIYVVPHLADMRLGSRLTGWGRVLVFPVAFTVMDWAMSLNPAITTAGSPAYSQIDNLALMQITSITGMWGVTFLVTWFASTANELWEHHSDWRPVRARLAIYASVLLAVILFGSVRLNLGAPATRSAEAATITADSAVLAAASKSIDWATFNRSTDAERAMVRPDFQAAVDQMFARTEMALRRGAKIVGSQEAAALVLEEDKAAVLDRASTLARRYGASVQISVLVATRSKTWPYLLNESILIDPDGRVAWTYDKTHPVKGGEAFVVIPGPGRLPLAATPYGRLSTAICYDLHFPALIRQAGRQGADILIAPYGENPPFESRAVAITRAIENGVSLVRPAGKGISLLADYKGRVLGSLDYFADSSGIMTGIIPTHGVRTIYSGTGDVFAYVCVAGLIFLVGWAFVWKERPLAGQEMRQIEATAKI